MMKPIWKIVWSFSKYLRSRSIIWYSTSVYLSRIIEIKILERYLYPYIYCIVSRKSQDMKTTEMPMNEWTDKDYMRYSCNGIVFSLKKEGNSVICYNMVEAWGHYANWNRPITEWQISHDSTYMKYLK